VKHYQRDNSSWIQGSRADPYDVARLLAVFMAIQGGAPTRTRKKLVISRLNQCIKDFIYNHYSGGVPGDSVDMSQVARRMEEEPPIFVAIKRINATSGPKRIAEELAFLRDLKGLHHVVPIVTASRWEDQVIAVSPYFHGTDFRVIRLSMMVLMYILIGAAQHLDNIRCSRIFEITFRGTSPCSL
jgi:hypothetical protein